MQPGEPALQVAQQVVKSKYLSLDWTHGISRRCHGGHPLQQGTLGRVAHGLSEEVLLRVADVTVKERKKLILVPRETPISLVHLKNFELLLQAGAVLLAANPSFYTRPQTVEQVVDTVVARVLDHLGLPQRLMKRWQEEKDWTRA